MRANPCALGLLAVLVAIRNVQEEHEDDQLCFKSLEVKGQNQLLKRKQQYHHPKRNSLTMFTSFILISLSHFAATISGLQHAERALEVAALNPRATTSGGWALINPSCGDGLQLCSGEFCCPSTLECNHNGYGNHCCPPGLSPCKSHIRPPGQADVFRV
jgi:hypothetical protein